MFMNTVAVGERMHLHLLIAWLAFAFLLPEQVVAFSISSATSAMTCWSLFGLFFFYSELIYAGYSQDLNKFTVRLRIVIICYLAMVDEDNGSLHVDLLRGYV